MEICKLLYHVIISAIIIVMYEFIIILFNNVVSTAEVT
jgi:hypothetical protein